MPRVAALCLIAALVAACERPVPTAVITPERGDIRESFSEPARTRLARTLRITMPITGRVGRVDLEPGDRVEKGQELVPFDRALLVQSVAEAQATLDELSRTRPEEIAVADAQLASAAAHLKELTEGARPAELAVARAEVESATADVSKARNDYERQKDLLAKRSTSRSSYEAAEALWVGAKARLSQATQRLKLLAEGPRAEQIEQAQASLKIAQQRLSMIKQGARKEERTRARARLEMAKHTLSLASVTSPIDGVVLEKHHNGEGHVLAGTVLLELGDLAGLEAVAEVLTQDALRLQPGSEVALDPGAGRDTIAGRVHRIEPAGFTKLSTLGVEQQRVRVIVRFTAPPNGIGVGFRLAARFFTRSKQGALLVPRFCVLQSTDRTHAVFVVTGGRLVRQTVSIGLRSDTQLEITDGLDDGAQVVATPDTALEPGTLVTAVRK